MENLKNLQDQELLKRLEGLNAAEHATILQIVLHLIEIEARKLYLPLGYQSLFSYCTVKLRYSEPAAGRRIAAARCIRDFPEVYDLLETKEVSLTTISLFYGVLNSENKSEVLTQIRGKSRSEVEAIVARQRPVKKVLEQSIEPVFVELKAAPAQIDLAAPSPIANEENPAPSLDLEERYKLSFSVSKEFMEKLNALKKLKNEPKLEVLFEALMEDALKRVDPKRRQERRNTKNSTPAIHSEEGRHIPASVRDAVLLRDSSQCTFESADGTRCNACEHLEIDHIIPFAMGGLTKMENLRVLCSAHNRFMAEVAYGKDFMRSFYNSKNTEAN